MGLRSGLRIRGDGNLWPARVERLRNRLDETLRRTGDERKLNIIPVGADGVIDDGPALDDGVAVGLARKDHAVGGFPHRHFADVADVELTLAGAERVEREMAQAGGVGRRKQLEIAIELSLEACDRLGAR